MLLRGHALAGGMLLFAAQLNPAHAAFQDPLDTPAAVSSIAQTARLTAIANAGDRLVAVGPKGHVLLSEDGGRNWQQVPVPLSSDLVAVTFVTPQKGWAVGHDGVILHSGDGGKTWSRQLDGRQAAKAIEAHYGKLAAAGDEDAIKLADDVKQFVADGADKPFLDILFMDELRGFAVGAFNLAFRTVDGGKTWEPIIDRTDNPQAFHLYALAKSEGTLYMVGEQGLIRRWNDQSGRFESIESPYRGSFFGAVAKGETLIAFGMRGNAYRSTDGGASWEKVETGLTGGITSGRALADGAIVLVSQAGRVIVSRDDGESFAEVPVSKPMPYFAVASAGADDLALVGANGVRVESIK